jgi:hypothetical protein
VYVTSCVALCVTRAFKKGMLLCIMGGKLFAIANGAVLRCRQMPMTLPTQKESLCSEILAFDSDIRVNRANEECRTFIIFVKDER